MRNYFKVYFNKDEVDLKGMEKYGKVTTLSLDEIFGY